MTSRTRVDLPRLQYAPEIPEGEGGNKFELLDITEE